MKNCFESIRNERQLKALTGLGWEAFNKRLEAFRVSEKELKDEEYRKNRKRRSRRPGGGQKGKLGDAENK